jgi:hypothetical protein
MSPKQNFFKVSGGLIQKKDNSKHGFSMFVKAIDDNHAVILVRDYLKNNAPTGNPIIQGIEKIIE